MAKKRYGYARVSTPKQNIERQIRNILAACPDAELVKDVYTRTSLKRENWPELFENAQADDEIWFDSVSRMSGNEDEGVAAYMDLYQRGVRLFFIREEHINTDVYKKAMERSIPLTGGDVDIILKAINEYLMKLAEEQIRLAFRQAEKEVVDLKQRTREGLETARRKGKQVGMKSGATFETEISKKAKVIIKKHAKRFGGSLDVEECCSLAKISRPSYFKYCKEIEEEMIAETENHNTGVDTGIYAEKGET